MNEFPKINIGYAVDLDFYRDYDPDFLWNKAQTLRLVTENLDEFKEFLKRTVGTDEGIDQKFVEGLNAEIHFTELHQFECFFALLLAVFQNMPHWIYLNEYRPGAIRQKAQEFLSRDIDRLTNDSVRDIDEFLLWAVYMGYGFLPSSDVYEQWSENLRGLEWMLERLAAKYIEGVEYNAYKHGLRLLTGPSYIGVFPENQPEKGFHRQSDNSLRFLEIKKGPKGKTARQTVKHFDPEDGIGNLSFMNLVLGIVKTCRLARLRGETKLDESFIINMDKEAVRSVGHRFQYSTPVQIFSRNP